MHPFTDCAPATKLRTAVTNLATIIGGRPKPPPAATPAVIRPPAPPPMPRRTETASAPMVHSAPPKAPPRPRIQPVHVASVGFRGIGQGCAAADRSIAASWDAVMKLVAVEQAGKNRGPVEALWDRVMNAERGQ